MIRTRAVRFLADEAGAVTMDWVALTAATVVVGLLGLNIVGQRTVDIAAEIETGLSNADLGDVVFVPSSSKGPTATSGAPNGPLVP